MKLFASAWIGGVCLFFSQSLWAQSGSTTNMKVDQNAKNSKGVSVVRVNCTTAVKGCKGKVVLFRGGVDYSGTPVPGTRVGYRAKSRYDHTVWKKDKWEFLRAAIAAYAKGLGAGSHTFRIVLRILDGEKVIGNDQITFKIKAGTQDVESTVWKSDKWECPVALKTVSKAGMITTTILISKIK